MAFEIAFAADFGLMNQVHLTLISLEGFPFLENFVAKSLATFESEVVIVRMRLFILEALNHSCFIG